MIIHNYPDGSEGYQYQIGDRVIVNRTIHGGWFSFGSTHAEKCVVTKIDPRDSWRIAQIDVRYSDDWGPASCFPWMLTPHAETLKAARATRAVRESKDREQAAFERWLIAANPSGDAESVQEQWEESGAKADFEDAESEREPSNGASVFAAQQGLQILAAG
ncbi:hypothetical protein [Nevskia ramosa]|uniref:hypothetical protein n=1 Tax=Nevskia ramosa TaxID=64002 RepID=UPI0023574AF0|nr:hypothetical protein [Nevskia ramosa]